MCAAYVLRILKPGGIWVNLGPLLYHYSDIQYEGSIEPTYEDLVLIIRAVGFEILVTINQYIISITVKTKCIYLFLEKRNQRPDEIRAKPQFDATKRISERFLCLSQTIEQRTREVCLLWLQ